MIKTARPRFITVVLTLFVCLAASGCTSKGPASVEDSSAVNPTHEYVIPPGTFARIQSGENIEVIPAQLHLNVGNVIRIQNLDNEGGNVGPFYVGAGETLTQRFTTKGVYEGLCNFHPSGRIFIEVT